MDNLLLRVLHQSSHLIHNHHISNELHSKQIMMHNVSGLCCTHRGKAANARVHINTLGDHSLLLLINIWFDHNHNSVTDSRLILVRGSQYLLMCFRSPHLTHKQASTKNQGMAKQRTRTYKQPVIMHTACCNQTISRSNTKKPAYWFQPWQGHSNRCGSDSEKETS